ncbi:aminotransferase class V-fold PLP-dependent enzyme [Acidobacteriota bacterium]
MEKPLLERFKEIHPQIRARFPQLEKDLYGSPRIYLNNGAGTVTVDSAADAMAQTFRTFHPMPGSSFPAEEATMDLHWTVRQIAADFLNADYREEISFHLSATNALFNLATSLGSILTEEHNLVVTDLDHMANVTPWEEICGKQRGSEVRRIPINDEGYLDMDRVRACVDRRTGLFAVTLASNGFGTIAPLKELISYIKEKSPDCLVCVDAVHHALHGSLDVQDMGCDFLVFSGYKIYGPMLGVLYGKKSVLERLKPYRVETNKNEIPFKFEQGMLNNAVLAALASALEYHLWLGELIFDPIDRTEQGRIGQFQSVMNAVALYDQQISRVILQGFQQFPREKFRCFGVSDPSRVMERDPTFAFEIPALKPEEIKRRLWEMEGIQIGDGNHYSAAVYRHLDRSSLCRASFAHYDSEETAQTFLEALRRLIDE